jgi:Fe-S-cluster-containing dehydrogenase component
MKVFIIDLSKCNGCYNCQIACKDEMVGNDWPPYSLSEPDIGQFWLKITEQEMGTAPKLKHAYVPQHCQHCDNAPCIKAAAPGAVYKRPDGMVIIDPVLSAGQKQLVAACPYGAVFWNAGLNIPQKCTACAHILDDSTIAGGIQTPRCVNACPTKALQFGDDSDPAMQALMSQGQVLHPEYGTKPRVYYLNLPTLFIAGAVYDPNADECLEGASVTASDLTTGQTYSATTDNYGDFWLEELPGERSYELNITKSGYLSKTMMVFLNEAKNVGDIGLVSTGA